mmetsp:Transcript_139893/g.447406  ORF Transcript_139893/g.447406 Transcript_139893/m.447406 type:complete len:281 (+) Transcript_139893:672-1514(+)
MRNGSPELVAPERESSATARRSEAPTLENASRRSREAVVGQGDLPQAPVRVEVLGPVDRRGADLLGLQQREVQVETDEGASIRRLWDPEFDRRRQRGGCIQPNAAVRSDHLEPHQVRQLQYIQGFPTRRQRLQIQEVGQVALVDDMYGPAPGEPLPGGQRPLHQLGPGSLPEGEDVVGYTPLVRLWRSRLDDRGGCPHNRASQNDPKQAKGPAHGSDGGCGRGAQRGHAASAVPSEASSWRAADSGHGDASARSERRSDPTSLPPTMEHLEKLRPRLEVE